MSDGIEISLCTVCAHYRGRVDGTDKFACAAYPLGIPEDILLDGEPHTRPRADQDNEIVFESMFDQGGSTLDT